MLYPTTITKKGQITIPKEFREALNLKPTQRVIIDLEKNTRVVKIKPTEDFLEVAKKIKVKKKTNVLKAREFLEKNYERI